MSTHANHTEYPARIRSANARELGLFAASLEPKDSTLPEYRARVEHDLRDGLGGDEKRLARAMTAFDLAIAAQEAAGCLRTVPPMASLGTYPDDVLIRAMDAGADRANQPRGRSSILQHRAKFEYELRHGLCGRVTPDLIGWFLAGFDDVAGLPVYREGSANPAFARNLAAQSTAN